MDYEEFCDKFNELPLETRIYIYNNCVNSGDMLIFPFDEDFWELFESKAAVAQAIMNSNIDWNCSYAIIDAAGCVQTLYEGDINDMFDDYMNDIFFEDEIWGEYIQES